MKMNYIDIQSYFVGILAVILLLPQIIKVTKKSPQKISHYRDI